MKVIFTCGGTAGHVNPALALAGYMRERDPNTIRRSCSTARSADWSAS